VIDALDASVFTGEPDDKADEIARREFRSEAWAIIERHYRQDCAKHDGRFFRALADAMEYHGRFPDPARMKLAIELNWLNEREKPMPTISEAYEMLKRAGFPVDKKTVGRMFKYCGFEPSTDKRG